MLYILNYSINRTDMSREKVFFSRVAQLIGNLRQFLKNEIWEKSFLLKRRRSELKRTLDMMEGAHSDLQEQLANMGKEDIIVKRGKKHIVPDGHMVIYILLTLKTGGGLSQWQQAIQVLPECYFGRPIYKCENMVKKVIRLKGNALNLGYVVVHVPCEKIIEPENEHDELGQDVVGLTPGAFTTEDIISFTHMNEHRYFLIQKKLVADK